jgi:hypothetical protein
MSAHAIASDESSDSAGGLTLPDDERSRPIIHMRPPMRGLPGPDLDESSSDESLDEIYPIRVLCLSHLMHH